MLFGYEVSIVLILLVLIFDVRRLCVLRMVSVVLALVAVMRGFYVESYSLTRRVDHQDEQSIQHIPELR